MANNLCSLVTPSLYYQLDFWTTRFRPRGGEFVEEAKFLLEICGITTMNRKRLCKRSVGLLFKMAGNDVKLEADNSRVERNKKNNVVCIVPKNKTFSPI